MTTRTTAVCTTPTVTGQALTLLAIVCCLAISSQARAQDDFDFFVPDNLQFYNPLKPSNGHRDNRPTSTGLDNVALYEAAQQYRSDIMSPSQRALNHQWLHQMETDDGVRHGSKVLSKIFKMGFKTYWKGVKNSKFQSNNLVPNANGKGKVNSDMDYRLRISGNKLKLSLEYDF